jgi:hypothetical protein
MITLSLSEIKEAEEMKGHFSSWVGQMLMSRHHLVRVEDLSTSRILSIVLARRQALLEPQEWGTDSICMALLDLMSEHDSFKV